MWRVGWWPCRGSELARGARQLQSVAEGRVLKSALLTLTHIMLATNTAMCLSMCGV